MQKHLEPCLPQPFGVEGAVPMALAPVLQCPDGAREVLMAGFEVITEAQLADDCALALPGTGRRPATRGKRRLTGLVPDA